MLVTRRRIAQCFAWTVVAAALLLAASAKGQTVKPNEVVKWDDYTFKFGPSAQMAQVLQGDKVVGTILMMNGNLQVLPLPGTDGDKLKKSFEDWKTFNTRSHGASSGGSSASPASGEPACPADLAPHYLAGSEWKPMTMVVSAGRENGVSMKEGLKNPLTRWPETRASRCTRTPRRRSRWDRARNSASPFRPR